MHLICNKKVVYKSVFHMHRDLSDRFSLFYCAEGERRKDCSKAYWLTIISHHLVLNVALSLACVCCTDNCYIFVCHSLNGRQPLHTNFVHLHRSDRIRIIKPGCCSSRSMRKVVCCRRKYIYKSRECVEKEPEKTELELIEKMKSKEDKKGKELLSAYICGCTYFRQRPRV